MTKLIYHTNSNGQLDMAALETFKNDRHFQNDGRWTDTYTNKYYSTDFVISVISSLKEIADTDKEYKNSIIKVNNSTYDLSDTAEKWRMTQQTIDVEYVSDEIREWDNVSVRIEMIDSNGNFNLFEFEKILGQWKLTK